MVKEAMALVEALPNAWEQGEIWAGDGEPCENDTIFVEELSPKEQKLLEKVCKERGLDPHSVEGAAAYVDEKFGPHLVLLCLKPADEEEFAEFYAGLVQLARTHGWIIENPQTGRNVNLNKPGRLPSGF